MSDCGVCVGSNPAKRGSFTLELTTSALCDLDCTYCFEGVKNNPKRLDDLDKLTKQVQKLLADDQFAAAYDNISITFWGGEPTLNTNYIIQVMNEFNSYPQVSFHIYSNGANIKNMKKIVESVDFTKLRVQLSYDGRSINDRFRITKNGKTSADMVLETFDYLANKGVNISIKSTLPVAAFSKINDAWDEFEKMFVKYKAYDNVRISWAPTIEQTMVKSSGERDVNKFREQFLSVAKKEIDFYQRYGTYLCTWFGTSDSKTVCSAGLNMANIDVDGDVYPCHGVLYSDNKHEVKSTSVYSDDMINTLYDFTGTFESVVRGKDNIPEACKTCVATYCAVCPAAALGESKKQSTIERWGDRHVHGLCEYYQAFGEIDRAVQHYTKTRKVS